MSSGFRLTGVEFAKHVAAHKRYLEMYALINNGSLKGATPFSQFFVYRTYLSKYSDPRACAPMGYR